MERNLIFLCYFVFRQGKVKTIKYKKEKILASTNNNSEYKFFTYILVILILYKSRYLYNPLT